MVVLVSVTSIINITLACHSILLCLNVMPQSDVPAMYRSTALAAVQHCIFGCAMCLASTPMACKMSGIVHTDRYSKAPASSL